VIFMFSGANEGSGRHLVVSSPPRIAETPHNTSPASSSAAGEFTGEMDSPAEQRGFEPLVPGENG